MRLITRISFGIAFLGGSAALAQQTPMPANPLTIATYASGADIEAAIARAKREIKPGAPLVVIPLLQFQPYTAFLEYRRGAWIAATHPDIEMFFVVAGSGTFVSGGELVGVKPGSNGNVSGTGLTGGTARPVTKGDFFIVPPGTAHMFPQPDSDLVLISIHLPPGPRG